MGRKKLGGNKGDSSLLLNLDLHPFAGIGLFILLILSPLSRGLFFPSEYLVAYQLVAIIFVLVSINSIIRREGLGPFSLFDYLPLGMAIVYLAATAVAVDKSGAVRETLEALAVCLLFWSVSRYVRFAKDAAVILGIIFLAGLIVAMVGLGAAAGYINYPGAYENGKIHSTLQYKNALAAYLAACQVLGFGFWLYSPRLWVRVALGPANLIILVTLILTQSRGGWLLYFVVVGAWLLGISRERLVRGLYLISFSALLAMLASRSFWLKVVQGEGYSAIRLFLVYILLSVVLTLLVEAFERGLLKPEISPLTKKLIAYGGVIYVAVVLSVYLIYLAGAVPRAAAQLLPAEVVRRASTISGTDPSFVGRLTYYKDALEIIRRHPWLGTGGGGWKALYHRYQESQYFSTEVHNQFLQVWVETGPVGALLFVSVWVVAIALLFRLWKRARGQGGNVWVNMWSTGIAALTLGVHSFFDFDLSLPALNLVVWSLLGVLRGAERMLEGQRGTPSPKRLAGKCLLYLFLGSALFVPAYSFYRAGVLGAEGARAMLQEDYSKAREVLLKAERLDPFTASYPADLAQVDAALGLEKSDMTLLEESVVKAKRAVRLEPYNPKIRVAVSFAYMIQGLVDQGVAEARALIDINPLDVTAYEHLGRTYIMAARYYLDQKEIYLARPYVLRARQLPEVVAARAKDVLPSHWQGPRLEVTPAISLVAGQAAYLQGEYEQAFPLLQAARKKDDISIEAMIWEAAARTKAGQESTARKLLSEVVKKEPRAEEYYLKLLALEPLR